MRCILFFVLIWQLTSCPVFAQSQNIVSTKGITSPLHGANIGKIFFTDRDIPVDQIKESDFRHTYTLTNKSDLFVTVFMGNSLTNYLHQMEPGLSADSLTKIGGYQFALMIDNHLIYKSNILGAPYPRIKDTATTISKPLINNQSTGGWWSESFWNRFMVHGGDSALTEGQHTLTLEIRPYLHEGDVWKEGTLIATGQLNLQVNRRVVIDASKISLRTVKPYNGLMVSTAPFDKNRIKELLGNIEEGVFKKITSIVVIKNGKLLIEEYFNGASRETLHNTRSVGKSFASTLTGIAIGEGKLKNEHQPLKAFYNLNTYAHYTKQKDSITIKDLLTMSAAFDGNDDDGDSPGNEENMYPTSDWVKFAVDLPLTTSIPRGQWHYFTAGVVLLGDILNKKVPGGLEQYAAQKLFAPLHISKYQWVYTPQKVPSTAGGLQMNALDFAKYGQLYKNGGAWNGQQIIPQAWVQKTFTPYKPLPGRQGEYYGYLFWNKKYKVGGRTCEAYYSSGNGGNKIFIFQDQPLVVVITATAYGKSYAHPQVDKIMAEYILPAVIDKE